MRLASFDWSPGGPQFRETRIGRCRLVYRRAWDHVELCSLRVHRDHRKQGHARAAMSQFLQEADMIGLSVLVQASALDKRTSQERLVAFYRSLGFEPTGRKVNVLGDPEMRRSPSPVPDSAAVCFPSDCRDILKPGYWIALPYPDLHGKLIAQVRSLDVSSLYLHELDERGRLAPDKRSYVERYVQQLEAGEEPPLIDVLEMVDGRLRVVDGHRRSLAAQQLGRPVRALVSPIDRLEDGSHISLVMERVDAWLARNPQHRGAAEWHAPAETTSLTEENLESPGVTP